MSVLADAMACGYSFRGGVPLVKDVPGPAARVGLAFHDLVETAISNNAGPRTVEAAARGRELPPSAEKKLANMWARFSTWWPTFKGDLTWQSEVPLAMDPDVGVARVPEVTDTGRTKNPRAGEITGRVDLFAIDGETLHVADVKTGVLPVPRAAVNLQVGYGAATFARLPILRGTFQQVRLIVLRISDYQVPWVDAAVKPIGEVEALIDRVSFLRSGIPSSEPVPHRDDEGRPVGPCRFCPARPACPAWVEDLEPALRASVGTP